MRNAATIIKGFFLGDIVLEIKSGLYYRCRIVRIIGLLQ